MKKNTSVLLGIISVLFFCGLFFLKCSSEKKSHSIRLRWIKAYPSENWGNVKTGIYWSLSYLGASLDSAAESEIMVREDSVYFTLDLEKAGFNQKALNAFEVIIDSLKRTEEFEKNKSIDLGRFLVLTEHSSMHYYRITDAARSIEEYYMRHPFANEKEFHVMNSGVATHERRIRFIVGSSALETAWIAEEGEGSLDSNSFSVSAYEVLDIMPNGQLRFAVYDQKGNLSIGSPKELGKAGKPSKCLWCHELIVQPLFFKTAEPKYGITIAEFGNFVDSSQHMIDRYRYSLNSIIKFENKQDHAQGELLYISFMEPSAYRIAKEWNCDSIQVKNKMWNLKTHAQEEFPFLGLSYYRYYVDSAASYFTAPVPTSVREPFPGEPDYFIHANSKK